MVVLIFIVLFIVVGIPVWCCCKVAGDSDRKEEELHKVKK